MKYKTVDKTFDELVGYARPIILKGAQRNGSGLYYVDTSLVCHNFSDNKPYFVGMELISDYDKYAIDVESLIRFCKQSPRDMLCCAAATCSNPIISVVESIERDIY